MQNDMQLKLLEADASILRNGVEQKTLEYKQVDDSAENHLEKYFVREKYSRIFIYSKTCPDLKRRTCSFFKQITVRLLV